MDKKSRRLKGEGSLFYRADRKRWVGRYIIVQPNGRKIPRTVSDKNKGKCSKKLQEAIVKARRTSIANYSGYTVESYYSEWLKARKIDGGLRPSTLEQYDNVFKKYILPYIGKHKLDSLNTRDVKCLVDYTYKTSKSGNRCRVMKNALSSMLSYARDEGFIADNIARGIKKMPKCKKRDIVLWDEEELMAFLEEAKSSSRYFALYMLYATYGLRRGEGLGLRKCDVELSDGKDNDWGVLKIRQQVSAIDNKPVIAKLKTESSERDIPINKEIHDVLRPLIEECSGGLIFHTANGTPIAPRNLMRDFKKIITRTGIRDTTIHSLRHLACDRLANKGRAEPKTLQRILGHSSITTTLGIYASANFDMKRAVICDTLPTLLTQSI